MILDWKQTASIKFDNAFRSLREPLQHLPESNGWLIFFYKYMLESEYDLKVSSMYLGQVHPCLPRARLIEVPCMRDELQLIVEDQIHRGEAISAALPDARFALPEKKRAVQTELVSARVLSDHYRCNCFPFSLASLSPPLSPFLPAREARDEGRFRRCCFD